MNRPRFHLAFPVDDLEAARGFYGGVLGCAEGRSSDHWIDFDMFGHQIVAHFAPDECTPAQTGLVDGKNVPVRHFGIILEWDQWETLSDRFRAADIAFGLEPYVRFKGEAGEQGTFFVRDPAGNALEFKAFRNDSMVFQTA
jgi:extradiol dioxygenase family protein